MLLDSAEEEFCTAHHVNTDMTVSVQAEHFGLNKVD